MVYFEMEVVKKEKVDLDLLTREKEMLQSRINTINAQIENFTKNGYEIDEAGLRKETK